MYHQIVIHIVFYCLFIYLFIFSQVYFPSSISRNTVITWTDVGFSCTVSRGFGCHQDVTGSAITVLNILDNRRIQELAAWLGYRAYVYAHCWISVQNILFFTFSTKSCPQLLMFSILQLWTWLNCHGFSYSRIIWLTDICCLLLYQKRKLQRTEKGKRPKPAPLMEVCLTYITYLSSHYLSISALKLCHLLYIQHIRNNMMCSAGYGYRE